MTVYSLKHARWKSVNRYKVPVRRSSYPFEIFTIVILRATEQKKIFMFFEDLFWGTKSEFPLLSKYYLQGIVSFFLTSIITPRRT